MTNAHPPFDRLQLVPSLKDWGDTEIDDWINAVGNHELAIGYSHVFWPRIVQFGDYFLIEAYADQEHVEVWEAQCKGKKSSVEAMLNHVHMIDLHSNSTAYTEAQLIELGRTLKEIYEAKLAWAFPGVAFKVEFDDTPGLDPVDYQLTFWRVRDDED